MTTLTNVQYKRLLFINLGAGFGGVEVYMEGLITLLHGHAELYALASEPQVVERLRARNVRTIQLPSGTMLHRAFRYLLGFAIMVWMVLRYKIDIVHTNKYAESALLLPFQLIGCRCYMTCHHLPAKPPLAGIYRRIIRRLEWVCCVSETTADKVRSFSGAHNVSVIQNWLQGIPKCTDFKIVRNGPTRVLFVGRLEEYKGLQVLIAALQGLPGIELIVIGAGKHRAKLEEQAKGLRVQFLGFVSDAERDWWYQNSDVIVNPSLGPEGSSLVALDAMARGVPCVLSDLPVFQEISDNGRAALLFRAGDPNDLRAKLLILLSRDQLRQECARYAYEMVRVKHNPETAQLKYLNAFGTVTSRHDRKKRILFVALGNEFGGAEIYLNNLIALLKEEADCFALCAHPEVARRLRVEHVEALCLPCGGRWVKLLRFLISPFAMVWMILHHRIDIIQINGFFEAILLLPARLLGCVAISTRHITFDLGSVLPRRSRPSLGWVIDELIYRNTVRFANRVICVSAAVGVQVRALLPSMPTSVIPNWITQIPPRMRDSFSLHRPVRVLFVGRLEKMKGLHLLIDALKGVESVTLTVVGNGDYRQELEQHASNLDVRFVGYQADPGAYYSEADVVVNPSLGPEGSSIVAMEAMAHCVPCLLSDLPVFREVAEDGKAAMLFRTGDVQHLRSQLLTLLADESLRRNYSYYGYSMVQAKHSVPAARRYYSQAFGIPVAPITFSRLRDAE